VKINDKGFLCCPRCKKPTKVKVLPNTQLANFPLYCTWCKVETIINLIQKARA
jgi:uncharacterized protein YbaR (Trm112 family)